MDPLVFKRHIKFVIGLVGILFFIVLWRLAWLQVVQGKSFRTQAEERYTASGGESRDRGDIYFSTRSGSKFTAASMEETYDIAIIPGQIIDGQKVLATLQTYIPVIDTIKYNESITKKTDPYEVIAKDVDTSTADAIKKLKIPGVRVSGQLHRYYPGKDLAAHVLGFVGYQGNELSGRYGIEKSYQDTLSRSYANLYSNFFVQLFSDIGNTLHKEEVNKKKNGGDIVTTIEPEVQLFVQRQVSEMQAAWNPEEIGVIIMDPKTGEIVSMAASPTFDVNEFNKVTNPSTLSNPMVQRSYEMGSVVKPLIVAFGLQEKAITPTTTYVDKGSVVVADRTIYNFDKKARGLVAIPVILQQSLNTGMVFIMSRLNKQHVHDYLVSLGIGQKTGIDLPYEAKGQASNIEHLRDVEYSNISFGQGVAWTPVQISRALSVLANHGKLVTPHVVKEIDYGDGFVDPVVMPEPVQVLDPNAVEQVTAMLINAADTNFGKGGSLFKHYTVAAKTGTAQVPSPRGGYYEDQHLHSFFGYFPAYNPKFTVFIYMLKPQGALYSAQTLSKPFINIVDFMLNYYNIPPDRGIIVDGN